jgi:SAM-dependent methyltransferase
LTPEDKTLYYESIGENFDRWISDYDTERRVLLLERLLAVVEKRTSALEVGCGTGRIAKSLQPQFDSYVVNDISTKLGAQVAQSLQCEQLEGDVTDPECTERQFPVVLSSEVLEHTPDPETFLRGLCARVESGGWLVLTTPNKLWYPALLLADLLRIRKFSGIENWVWPYQVSRWLEEEGFVRIKYSGCHLFPWQVPGAKALLPSFDRYGDVLYPFMINFGVRAQRPAR